MEEINKYYRENYTLLVKRMNSRMGNMQDAEDVVQDAFVRACKYYKSCNVDFDRWFKVILGNCAKAKQSENRLGGLTTNIDDAVKELPAVLPNHISALARVEVQKIINSQESGDVKETIRLNIMFGYTPAEIAFLVNVKHQKVKNILKKFNKEMKEAYA